jgi:F0F1-type ATP synthase membrane subunit b/b'
VNNSLPFPIRGIAFVPKDKASAIEEKLAKMQERFNSEVKTFCADYTVFREQAKDHLGNLYDETAYPPNIDKKFSFGWQFFSIGMGDGSKVLSPAVYEREKAKFEQQMADFSENAVATLRLKFLEMLDHIVTRLAGGNVKVFRDSLIETPKKFMEDFAALNICDDKALEAMVGKVGALLDGVNPEMLRDDVAFRSSVANQVAQVEVSLAKLIKETPSRMLDIDWDEEPTK